MIFLLKSSNSYLELIQDGFIDGEFVAIYPAADSLLDTNRKFPNNLGNVVIVDWTSFRLRNDENIDTIGESLVYTNYS